MTADSQWERPPTIFNSPLILFFVGIFLFLALLYRQIDLALLSILVFIIIGGAMVWGRLSSARISCTSTVDCRRLFPGETVAHFTTVENGKWLPISVRIDRPQSGGVEPVGNGGERNQQQASMLWYQTAEFHQRFTALHRGVFRLGAPRIRTSDLLGFFEKEAGTANATEIIVYPRIVPLRSIDVHRRAFFDMPGAVSPVQDPVYILGTRDYQPSSPSRHIHWKASARHQRPQEKVFEPSEQEKALLVIDAGSFSHPEDKAGFETILEAAASIAIKLDRMGTAMGLVTNGFLSGRQPSSIPVSRGPNQITAILEALARIEMKAATALEHMLERALRERRGVSCYHFCRNNGPSGAHMARYYQHRKVPATLLIHHWDDDTPLPGRHNGVCFHAVDDVRQCGDHP
jgi:uncharacterized protein (DUF58 family)